VEFSKSNRIGLWYKPWFYKHVESFLHKKGDGFVEYIPTRDYYHRHTKSIFWELAEIIPWGNNIVFRFLLGWAVPPKVSFLKLTQTQAIRDLYDRSHVIQDMLVPMNNLKQAYAVFDKEYDVYPLWLCPYRAVSYKGSDAPHRCFLKEPKNLTTGHDYLQIGEKMSYEMFVDLGAYGIPSAVKQKKPFDIVAASRIVEHAVVSMDGFQMLYATTFMTEEEFKEMFDHRHYLAMKEKYDSNRAFPEIYNKVSNGLKKKSLAHLVKANHIFEEEPGAVGNPVTA
jgi:delta24-sterol reductase